MQTREPARDNCDSRDSSPLVLYLKVLLASRPFKGYHGRTAITP